MKNPYAFPSKKDEYYNGQIIGSTTHPGMTLRDYFASQAMIGIMTFTQTAGESSETTAQLAYMHADAMLKARGDE